MARRLALFLSLTRGGGVGGKRVCLKYGEEQGCGGKGGEMEGRGGGYRRTDQEKTEIDNEEDAEEGFSGLS